MAYQFYNFSSFVPKVVKKYLVELQKINFIETIQDMTLMKYFHNYKLVKMVLQSLILNKLFLDLILIQNIMKKVIQKNFINTFLEVMKILI